VILLPPSGFARAFPALATPFTRSPAKEPGLNFAAGHPPAFRNRTPAENSALVDGFASKGDRLPCSRLSGIWIVWSWRRDLNPRPPDYKSGALPAELRQPETACTLTLLRHTEASQNSRGTRQDFSMGVGEVQWWWDAFVSPGALCWRMGKPQVLRLRFTAFRFAQMTVLPGFDGSGGARWL
jgi:hypothetical protein